MPHTLFLRLFRTTLVLNQLLNCILYLDGSNKQQRRPFFEAQRGGLRIVIVPGRYTPNVGTGVAS